MSGHQDLIRACYAAFNARDFDAALTGLHADVDWPEAIDGGRGARTWRGPRGLVGAIRDDRSSHRAQAFSEDELGRIVVDVHQIVGDLDGGVIADHNVQHVYTISDGLIARMDIRNWPWPAELDAGSPSTLTAVVA